MKRTIWLVLILAFVLAGCKGEGEAPLATADAAAEDSAIQNENKLLNDQLILMQAQLQATEQELENLQIEMESKQPIDPYQELLIELTKQYPALRPFAAAQTWTSVTITNDLKTNAVLDPELLEIIGSYLVITGETIDFTNGPQSDIDNFSLLLANESGTYKIDIAGRDVMTFPELAPGVYFRISSNTADVGKALMSKPDYVPTDSWETRMLNSGMIHVKAEDSQFYMVSAFRTRGVAIQLLNAAKQEIAQPQSITENVLEEITFYLYGNKIQMNVYSTYIQIKDGSREIWYQVDKEVPKQIQGFISAG
ncbi:hypothetical protein MHI37_26330 [Paenibacillus sp. FSL H8-0548]|uniref:hypothetical protein n=1 Tax=Paenibacillus sp. FSL H8-0548 TaxID=1920422 RepID=UPI00117E5F49|nr:hypothetical protein [Paenibacillus sp. FSL H8-0548]